MVEPTPRSRISYRESTSYFATLGNDSSWQLSFVYFPFQEIGPCVDYDPFRAVPGLLVETEGRKIGFSYRSLRWCQVTSQGLVLRFSQHRILLQGTRLPSLSRLIDGHQVFGIRAAPAIGVPLPDALYPWITEIRIEPHSSDERR